MSRAWAGLFGIVLLGAGSSFAADTFPHGLPLEAELAEEAPPEEGFLFSERARERSLLSVIATADFAFDTFGPNNFFDGLSAGVVFSDTFELLATARHVATWEFSTPTHGITGGFQVGARLPLDLQARYWLRAGFEMGFSPGGPISLLTRLHVQLRMRLGQSVWLGAALLNPVMRTHQSRVVEERVTRLGLYSGFELLVLL